MGQTRAPTISEMHFALEGLGLNPAKVAEGESALTSLGLELSRYFEYRAEVLNDFAESQLMNREQSPALLEDLQAKSAYPCTISGSCGRGDRQVTRYQESRC